MPMNPTVLGGRRDVLVTLMKLPPECFTVLNSDPCLVIGIKRGVLGYVPLRRKPTLEAALAFANDMNDGTATPAQVEAMECGSMFGWEVPGADPDQYEGGWELIRSMFQRGDFETAQFEHAEFERAKGIVAKAEADLRRPLSDPQRRDLLADNTDWALDKIRAIVADAGFPRGPLFQPEGA